MRALAHTLNLLILAQIASSWKQENGNPLEGATKRVPRDVGNIVGGNRIKLKDSPEDTQNPLLGHKVANKKKLISRQPDAQPQPQLGEVVGGLISGLGSLAGSVGSVGQGVTSTLGAILGPLLGFSGGSSKATATPSATPRPSARPSPSPTPENRKLALMSVTINREPVSCRRYPDTTGAERQELPRYGAGARLDVLCWSNPSFQSNSGRVDGEGVWLQTKQGCFVNGADLWERDDFKAVLNECPPTRHWVGVLQNHYSRKDCYECPSLTCPSRDVGNLPYADLDCHVQGEDVRGDSKWYKSEGFGCFYPAGVFNSSAWLGPFGDVCKRG